MAKPYDERTLVPRIREMLPECYGVVRAQLAAALPDIGA